MTLEWREILDVASDSKISMDIDKQTNLKETLVLFLREAIDKQDVSTIINLSERFTQKLTENGCKYHDSLLPITREIYKNALIIVSNDIAKLNERSLNQIISGKVGQIEAILAIASLIDNKQLIKKMLDLVERNIKNNLEEQQVLLKSLINILTYSIKNERFQTIGYICHRRFSQTFCPVIRGTYIKAFADSKVVKELEKKIKKQEKSTKYELWMELKKYLAKMNNHYPEESKPKENNVISQNKKMYIVATSALVVAGIISGIAIAVYSGMLAVGIAVGVFCLIAAEIIYYCNKPSKLLENSNAEVIVNQITVA
ncbi:hypothetical protein JR053_04295 [Wolbachia endosymbiont of Nasonia vitripennis]|uniref:TomO hydrophobic C-terminal domain-containing protein n=1 Tax=Wolbachia endosymbiont of Nasonia vitripennis TaxID=180837 RepID=UPI003A895512